MEKDSPIAQPANGEIRAEVRARTDERGRLVMSLKHTTNEEKLQMLERESVVLYELESVFPFDFFPNKIVVKENKIELIERIFFNSARVYTMLVRDLNAITISTSLFFASINFEIKGYETNPPHISYLKKDEALRAHHVISGLISMTKVGVTLGQLSPKEVLIEAERLGVPRSVAIV